MMFNIFRVNNRGYSLTVTIEFCKTVRNVVYGTDVRLIKVLDTTRIGKFIVAHGAKTRKVLIVGLNPSNASPDSTPFESSTASRKKVETWFSNKYTEEDYEVFLFNVINEKRTEQINEKELRDIKETTKRKFESFTNSFSIIALGNKASYALDQADIEHFKMPHPSGLNHFWNDVEKSDSKIREMLEWIETKGTV